MLTMTSMVKSYSKKIKDDRTLSDVLGHAMEELGELATEIKIVNGKSYKKPGKDGVVGEALDLINCALDIIYLVKPDYTETELMQIQFLKCEKWVEKVDERKSHVA